MRSNTNSKYFEFIFLSFILSRFAMIELVQPSNEWLLHLRKCQKIPAWPFGIHCCNQKNVKEIKILHLQKYNTGSVLADAKFVT